MKHFPSFLHPSFKLNGLEFQNCEELLYFASKLKKEGDEYEVPIANFIQKWFDESDSITVKTSGSTGKSKKIKLLKENMANSALATGAYFNSKEETAALLCLPADYIAGKMMLVRAMVLGWHLHIVAPEKDALRQYDNTYDFVAMVPYQAFHSIKDLKKVKQLIIGGGSISKDLEAKLQDCTTEVFATYGMTETISHIAVRRVNGPKATKIFSALPQVAFSLDARGCLCIDAPLIASEKIMTNDLVTLLSPTTFKYLGRIDSVINTGGIKVHPELIEEKLAPHIALPFLIASEADEALGERVILILEKKEGSQLGNYSEAFASLQPFEKPKKIYTISQFVYTETGKIKRGDILQMLQKFR